MPLRTKWTPTANMEAALKYIQQYTYACSITDMCEAIGIRRTSYYEWFQTPGFVKWWRGQWEGYFGRRMPAIYGAAAARAEGRSGARGSTRDAKLLAERFDRGYAPKTRQEHSGETTLKTYINVDVPRVAGDDSADSVDSCDPESALDN